MKKYLLSSLIFAALTLFSAIEAKPFGNYYSTSTQLLLNNNPVTFEGRTLQDKVVRMAGEQLIKIHRAGIYWVTFTATGTLTDGTNYLAGSWSLGLYQNGVPIYGAIAATQSIDDGEILTVTGQAFIETECDDVIQLINVSSSPIFLVSNISGGSISNTSASLAIKCLKEYKK